MKLVRSFGALRQPQDDKACGGAKLIALTLLPGNE
jgi:hypothetical protein